MDYYDFIQRAETVTKTTTHDNPHKIIGSLGAMAHDLHSSLTLVLESLSAGRVNEAKVRAEVFLAGYTKPSVRNDNPVHVA